jgi:hypothetical protein
VAFSVETGQNELSKSNLKRPSPTVRVKDARADKSARNAEGSAECVEIKMQVKRTFLGKKELLLENVSIRAIEFGKQSIYLDGKKYRDF